MTSQEFPWTYDQYQRYRVLGACLKVFFADKRPRVLDVGGLSPHKDGQGFWFPVRRIENRHSFVLDQQQVEGINYIQGDGATLPFRDRGFDVVCSLDVLEHVPRAKRPRFLAELSRVAAKIVLLSAPRRSPEVETAESALAEQIERLYGAGHCQLEEHRQLGLPQVEEVAEALRKELPAVAYFFYGSLRNWLLIHSLRHAFLGRRSSRRILDALDRWMTSLDSESEWQPPFYRCFWVGARELESGELEERINRLKEKLQEPLPETDLFNLEAAKDLGRAMVEYIKGDKVSAVVVTTKGGTKLKACLEHLLSQQVDFDLEVAVWFFGQEETRAVEIERLFPGVKIFLADKGEKTFSGLGGIIDKLMGNHFLLLSEDILLPNEAVQKFYEELRAHPEAEVISPRIQFKRYLTPVWLGSWAGLEKILAGRLPAPQKKAKPVGRPIFSSWIYSECLFFSKKALFSRVWDSRLLSRRRLFLWRAASPSSILYSPWITVYKA